jgi:hypothetical protein
MVSPLWWVVMLEWNVLERNWEMNQVEIDIVETEVIKCSLACWFNELLSVLGIPEVAGDKEILSLDDALINGSLDALTAFFLVTIYSCLINQSVAQLDGVVNAISAFCLIDLPASKTN